MTLAVEKEMCYPDSPSRRAYCPAMGSANHQVTPFCTVLWSASAARGYLLQGHDLAGGGIDLLIELGRGFKKPYHFIPSQSTRMNFSCFRASHLVGWNFVGVYHSFEFCLAFLLCLSFTGCWSLIDILYSTLERPTCSSSDFHGTNLLGGNVR